MSARAGSPITTFFRICDGVRVRFADTTADSDVTVLLPAIETRGRYLLKFDLVNEGVDWFERCGSETTTRSLLVI